jgi:hypothetical protein
MPDMRELPPEHPDSREFRQVLSECCGTAEISPAADSSAERSPASRTLTRSVMWLTVSRDT